MIVTWLADVSALCEEAVYRQYYEQIPKWRKEKADRLKMKEDKALSVGAWILLKQMKKEYRLLDNFIFNISHSGAYALCTIAVGENAQCGEKLCASEVGCDIERVDEGRFCGEQFKLAERFFCPEECEQIRTADDFYRFWVLKESFMKATRMGMKLPLDSFAFGFKESGEPFLTKQPETFPKEYYFKEYNVENLLYKIAVCSDCNAFAEKITFVRL